MMLRFLRGGLFGAAMFVAASAGATPGEGTLGDPIRVDAFPYAIAGSTVGAPSNEISAYDCAPATNESGPEVVYEFTLDAPARVTAWVAGDTDVVDIDVHLLNSIDLMGGVANGCLSRGNHIAEANMMPGTHHVVVDTWNGAAQVGPYVLRIDAIGDAWNERIVADGVVWKSRRFGGLAGGPQVIHGLVVDQSVAGVEVKAFKANGCETIAAMASANGAVAAVNGGYFGGATCGPVSLLRSGGALLGTNAKTRGAFGLDAMQNPFVALVNAGQDWPEVDEAHGGGPILVVNGVANQGAGAWAAEDFTDSAFVGKNPRTIAGSDTMGHILFGTIDGRRPNAAGMSLDALATFAVSPDFGAVEAVNLDGGGSTTMWIRDATYNGVVNYPSDDPNQEVATHPGSRVVSGGFFVFANPYNHAPRFQTQPVTGAAVGAPYVYDADALDLNVDDALTFSLEQGPAGMTVDPTSGVVTYTPPADALAEVDVVLVVSDDQGAYSAQAYTIDIEGGQGTGGGDAGGAGGAGGAGPGAGGSPIGAGASGQGGGPGLDGGPDERRCSCRVPGGAPEEGAWLGLGIALSTLAFGRRARRKTARNKA